MLCSARRRWADLLLGRAIPGLLLGLALVVACAPPAAPAAGPPSQPAAPPALQPSQPAAPTVRMGGLGGQIDAPLFVGQTKGYFAEQGLTLEVSNFVTASEMVPLLVTGRLDAGHGA